MIIIFSNFKDCNNINYGDDVMEKSKQMIEVTNFFRVNAL